MSFRPPSISRILIAAALLILGGVSLLLTRSQQSPNNVWHPVGSLRDPRIQSGVSILADGRVLITGGLSCVNGKVLASCEMYDVHLAKWSISPPMAEARYGHTTSLLSGGRVLVCGGLDQDGKIAGCEIYDSRQNKWLVATQMGEGRFYSTSIELPDGSIMVAGGFTSDKESLDYESTSTTEIYDSHLNTWHMGPEMIETMAIASTCKLSDGTILAIGGGRNRKFGHLGTWHTGISTGECFNPISNKWLTLGSDLPPFVVWRPPFLTLLRDGKFFCAGNTSWLTQDSDGNQNYDTCPNSNYVQLPSGDILQIFSDMEHESWIYSILSYLGLAGHLPNWMAVSPIEGCQTFDTKTSSWHPEPPPSVVRSEGTLILLKNDEILLIGGDRKGSCEMANASSFRR